MGALTASNREMAVPFLEEAGFPNNQVNYYRAVRVFPSGALGTSVIHRIAPVWSARHFNYMDRAPPRHVHLERTTRAPLERLRAHDEAPQPS